MSGVERIAAERQRQIEEKGWTLDHDDEHDQYELLYAADSYTWAARIVEGVDGDGTEAAMSFVEAPRPEWPWWHERNLNTRYADDPDRIVRTGPAWWNPSEDPIRNLEKAGALIAAEIDRLERAAGE